MTDLKTDVLDDAADEVAKPKGAPRPRRVVLRARAKRIVMRPRRILVRLHRWVSLTLLAWLFVASLSGAWLVEHHAVESWFNSERYRSTEGDVGPDAAMEAAKERVPDDATVYGVTYPRNGRGVYQVGFERPVPGAPEPAEGEEGDYIYERVYVDPGSGEVNGIQDEEEGLTHWLYRGHLYVWQDHGVAGVFDPDSGWCRDQNGHEPGGVKGVVCDVIPDGMDLVAWFGVGFIFVLVSGFYLWYWPGARRWATALVVKRGRGRFTFHLSLHKVIGLVVWVPLLMVAFTGAAFAFPNMKAWYENATPAGRDAVLWEPPEAAYVSSAEEGEPIGLDGFAAIIEERYPERAVNNVAPPADETGTYTAWVSRGYDPWTREGGAGNTYVIADQYTGKILYDGTPEDGSSFDQAWSDWSYPLHTGDSGGTATRLVWIVLGFTPVALGTTGLVMNLVRRRKRAARAARAA